MQHLQSSSPAKKNVLDFLKRKHLSRDAGQVWQVAEEDKERVHALDTGFNAVEMEQGNESLKHQGNRTRTCPENNDFISEVIRTVSQIQTHRNLKNDYTLEMLWVFSGFFIKSPGHYKNSWTL